MRSSIVVRWLIAFVLAASFLAAPPPASTYADSDNQTSTENITTGEAPVADFMAGPTSAFVDDDVQFTDVSTGNPTSWAWDFDNDGTIDSTEQNPVYQYPDEGTYTVTLTVTNAYGLDTETKADYIMVSEAPVPETGEPAAAAPPLNAAEPLATNEPLVSILSMSNAATPLRPEASGSSTGLSVTGLYANNWEACRYDDEDDSYVYRRSTNNNYRTDLYNLTTFSPPDSSCNINSVTVYLRARASTTPSQPSAYISISSGGSTPNSSAYPFTLTTSYDVYSYSWLTNPAGSSWTWTQINSLQAGPTLRRPTASSSYDSRVTAVWVVVNYGPKANFTASTTSGCAPLSVTFTDTSSGTITSRNWSFGDGTPNGSGTPVTHQYTTPGTYTVTLTVSTASCGSDTKTMTNYINVGPPLANFTASPTSGCAPLTVNFVDNSIFDPNTVTNPTSWNWSFGDGTPSSTLHNPTHQYTNPGTYTVSLTVSNTCGSGSKTIPNYITVGPPTVTISGNTDFCEGSTTTITANVSGGTPPYTYDWSASTALGSWSSDNNTFIATNSGTVRVTVTDSAHCKGVVVSDTNTQVTDGNVPGASYPYNAVLAWVHGSWWSGLTYNFGSSTAQWIWESYRPAHPVDGDIVYFQRAFTIPGTPTGAILYATCDNGYEASINGNTLGRAQLESGWETSDLTENYVHSSGWQSVETYIVPPSLLNGNGGTNTLSIAGVNEYSGTMEGGTPGTVDGNPGGLVYQLVYESIYNCGCSATSNTLTVTRRPAPSANFSGTPLSGFAPLTVTFSDNSTGSPSSWAWDFNSDNVTDSTLQNPPPYTYNTAGIYSVKLTVTTSPYGCSNSITKYNYVTVNPAPTAPTVSELEIYTDFACNNPATTMSPLTPYYARARVNCNDKLSYLQSVQVTLFYNSSGDNTTAPGPADTQTCAILTCAVGALPIWSSDFGSPPSPTTTWQIVTDNCSQPADLTATTGYWKFAFIPGKVAHESISPAHWDAKGTATNKAAPPQSGEQYKRDKNMNWYGEITVNSPVLVNWGEVPLGLTSDNTTYNPKAVSVHYIANGDYYEEIQSSATWQNPAPPAPPTETVTLDETGIDPPALPGRFALKADDTTNLGSAITVMSGTYNPTNDTGGLTTEAGVTVNTNSLWLSLSKTGIAPVVYSGTIYYQIAKRP
jgi:PKD repeat protein